MKFPGIQAIVTPESDTASVSSSLIAFIWANVQFGPGPDLGEVRERVPAEPLVVLGNIVGIERLMLGEHRAVLVGGGLGRPHQFVDGDATPSDPDVPAHERVRVAVTTQLAAEQLHSPGEIGRRPVEGCGTRPTRSPTGTGR